MSETTPHRNGTLGFMVVSLVVMVAALVLAGLRFQRTAPSHGVPAAESSPTPPPDGPPEGTGPGSLSDASPNM